METGGYFLPRAEFVPLERLLRRVWPWLEEWDEWFRLCAQRRSWAEGGLDADDVASEGFIKLMKHLRIILLQDLAILQLGKPLPSLFSFILTNYSTDYPRLELFAQPLFLDLEWASFAHSVQNGGVEDSAPRSLLLKRALPEMSNFVATQFDASLHHTARLASGLSA